MTILAVFGENRERRLNTSPALKMRAPQQQANSNASLLCPDRKPKPCALPLPLLLRKHWTKIGAAFSHKEGQGTSDVPIRKGDRVRFFHNMGESHPPLLTPLSRRYYRVYRSDTGATRWRDVLNATLPPLRGLVHRHALH